jgi:Fur family transcriptional regulator, iron response regulator
MGQATPRSPFTGDIAGGDRLETGKVRMSDITDQDLADRLRGAGVALTLQRLVIARVLLSRPVHLTADQVWGRAKEIMPEISRATVYNTLDLFERSALLRRLIVDAEKVVFDSNTAPHHHLYDAATGEVIDIAAGELRVIGMPTLPPGMELEDVDVVVRVRRREA